MWDVYGVGSVFLYVCKMNNVVFCFYFKMFGYK